MKTRKASFVQPVVMLTVFCLFTLLVSMVDFRAIGPRGAEVGLASINGAFHSRFGYNDLFYVLSKILGYICFLIPVINLGVAVRDIYRKKSLFKVGPDVLGAFCIYVLMAACYILFEKVVLNYRPVLMDGQLEASYPSSHSLMGMTLCLTAALQLNFRDRNLERKARNQKILIALGILVVITRLFSGVHWLTDILGGVLLALTLVTLYVPLVRLIGRLFYKDKKGKVKPSRRPRQGHGGAPAKSPSAKHERKEKAGEEMSPVKEKAEPEEAPAKAPAAEAPERPAPGSGAEEDRGQKEPVQSVKEEKEEEKENSSEQ